MKWIREWAYNALTGASAVTSKLSNGASSVYSAGRLTEKPVDRTFIVISVATPITVPGMPARRVPVDVWAHDKSGGYTTIDGVITAALDALESAALASDGTGLLVIPQGESGELADESFGTLMRSATVVVVEKWDLGGPR